MSINHHVMNDARDLVDAAAEKISEIHTVTIIMNDDSPEVTIQGYTDATLDEHLTITTWKGHTVYTS